MIAELLIFTPLRQLPLCHYAMRDGCFIISPCYAYYAADDAAYRRHDDAIIELAISLYITPLMMPILPLHMMPH